MGKSDAREDDQVESWLTDREIEVCTEIMKFGSVSEAAKSLHLEVSTLYSVIYRVRKKLTKSRHDVNMINNWRRTSQPMAKLLVPYMKIVITSDLGD